MSQESSAPAAAPSVSDLQQSLEKLHHGDAPRAGVSADVLALAKEDLAAKAAIKEARASAAAQASSVDHEKLAKVETRGEGISQAVLEAAKADRELKKAVPRNAAVMASSESHLQHVDPPVGGQGLSQAILEAAKQDLDQKRVVKENREAMLADAIAQGKAGLKHSDAPADGVSAAVLEAAKLDRELKTTLPKQAAAAIGNLQLKHVEEVRGEGLSIDLLNAAKEDLDNKAQVAKAKKAIEANLQGAIQALNHVDAPQDGLSQKVIDSAKQEAEAQKAKHQEILALRKEIAAELASAGQQQ